MQSRGARKGARQQIRQHFILDALALTATRRATLLFANAIQLVGQHGVDDRAGQNLVFATEGQQQGIADPMRQLGLTASEG